MNPKKLYETTFIVNAAFEDQDIDGVVSKVTSFLQNNGGEIVEVNKWGRRRLAYPINKKFNGYYVHLVYSTLPSSVPSFERLLLLDDTIMRHLILELPVALQELRKQRALTEGKTGSGNNISIETEEKTESKVETVKSL
jgi:small subunit ribosomal protein S6